jgi:hypothetical protein
LLTEQMYDFMLYPAQVTLTTEANRRDYVLHPLYMQGLWFYNATSDEWMEEVPVKGTLEIGGNPYDAPAGQVNRFMLTSVVPVQKQPLAGGSVITVTASALEGTPTCTVTIQGITSGGIYNEETLGALSSTTVATSTTVFTTITGVVKNGVTWTRNITLTDSGGNTLLTLLAAERGKQFRQLELTGAPSGVNTIVYRFYQKPRLLEDDYDTVQVPEEFDQILVLRALISIAGFTKPSKDEMMNWQMELAKMENNLRSTYTQTRTLGGRPKYIQYRER